MRSLTLLVALALLVASSALCAQVLSYAPPPSEFDLVWAMECVDDGTVLALTGPGDGGMRVQLSTPDAPPTDGGIAPGGMGSDNAIVLPDGRLLNLFNGEGAIRSLDGTWSATAPMPTARRQGTAVLLPDGRVFVAGGYVQPGYSQTAEAEIYDPTADAWTPVAPMTTPRVVFSLDVLADGRVAAVGGTESMQAGESAEIYDPATDTWERLPNPLTAREEHDGIVLRDGRLLITGGRPASSLHQTLATAEIYDPATNAWSVAAPMPVDRLQHRSALLPDGRVFVVGGWADLGYGAERNTAVVYDPPSNSWLELEPTTVDPGLPWSCVAGVWVAAVP